MPMTAIELLEIQAWTAAHSERLATLADLAGDYEQDEQYDTFNDGPPQCKCGRTADYDGRKCCMCAPADPFRGIPDAHGEADWRF